MRDAWEWMKQGELDTKPLSQSYSTLSICNVKAAVSENSHFLCPSLCTENFPLFHLLDKQTSPRNSFRMRRNSNFYLSFSHPSASSVRKLRTSSAWKQLPFQLYLNPSCLQEAVLALSTADHRSRAPHSAAPLGSAGEPPPCPAATLPRKGTEFLSGLFG